MIALPERYLLILAPCAFYASDYRTASLAARRLATNSTTRQAGLYWESRAGQQLAVAALTRAGQIDANSPGMHVLLGDVYRQKRKWGDAELEFGKALALAPENRSARLGLAAALLDDGDSVGALAADKDLLLKNPDDPEANLLAGEILVQQHEFADAEGYLNKVRGIQPESLPHLHALLGEVYANTDRIPEAMSELKLGLANDEDGRLHFQLGRLYQKTGDKKSAAEAFQASQQLRKTWDDRASVALQQSTTDISHQ
jgi:predicted Zn-dependent protease